MATTFLEAGGDATFGTEFYSSVSGTVTLDSGTTHLGPRSIKVDTTGSAVEARLNRTGVLADAGRRINIRFKPNTLPTSGVYPGIICLMQSDTTSGILFLEFRGEDSFLQLTVAGGSVVGTGTHALSTAAFNRVTFSYTITNTTTWSVKVYVDGVLDINVSNAATLARTASNCLVMGWVDTGWGTSASKTANYDNVYVDDTADLTDPGDIRITSKLPLTVNNNNYDTTGGNGNVNERPLSETNYKQQAASSQVDQDYTLEGADVGDVQMGGNTIVARSAWVWAKGTAGGAGPAIINNGSTSAKTLTASPALYTDIVDSASYPSNATGIGLRSSGTADDTFLYECGMLIAFLGEPTQGTSILSMGGLITIPRRVVG